MIKSLQYQLIRMFHAILNSLNIDTILNLAYLIGPLYYVFSFKNTFKLYKRREKIKNYKNLNYNPMTVKINYVKYWLETLWLSKDNFEKDVMNKVVIKNQSYLDTVSYTHLTLPTSVTV